jgi:hypothetical protein
MRSLKCCLINTVFNLEENNSKISGIIVLGRGEPGGPSLTATIETMFYPFFTVHFTLKRNILSVKSI